MDLFAYGTLMVPGVMQSVCGYSGTGDSAVLRGYRRRLILGELYPAIIPWSGDSVDGTIYAGVSARQWLLIDAFEGEIYRRVEVEVISGSGEHRLAQSYVLASAFIGSLSDEPWSLDAFVSDGLRGFFSNYRGFAVVAAEEDRSGERH